MRFLADTNIASHTVKALRADGHDVDYAAERKIDPGDEALLRQAVAERRIVLTKDHDFGALVFAHAAQHAGVVLIDDLGDPTAEATLVSTTIARHSAELSAGAFLRVDANGAVRSRP